MNSLDLHIGDANKNDAFLSNSGEWDVAMLSRYTAASNAVGSDEHVTHLLNDEQWQALINRVDAVDELVAAARNCVDVICEDYGDRGDCGLWSKPGSALRRLENVLAKLEENK